MKIVSWNVNSIRSRMERVCAWLHKHQPEVVCLQELKALEDQVSFKDIEALGYHVQAYGQKAYNGVAVFAREKPTHVRKGFQDAVDDPQARCLAVRVYGVDVVCVYVPNGAAVGTDKYLYKLQWLQRLRGYLETHYTPSDRLVLCGDFNVAPRDVDVADIETWKDSVLCHQDAREALKHVCAWGLEDVSARFFPEGGVYSWWDYRQLGFQRNEGLRIDLLLCTQSVVCTDAGVDREERKGDKPSDHAPVWVCVQP
jgi:exodeoxyribonuclease-3